MYKHLAVLFTALLIESAVAIPIFAQSYQGGMRGTVSDAAGGLIMNARVTVSNTETGLERKSVSDSAGQYVFSDLNPGTYSIHSEAPGFSGFTRTNLTVSTQAFIRVDITLQVGSATQSVEVHEDVPLVDSDHADTGQSLDRQKLTDLPILGRNPYILTKISPNFMPVGNPQFSRFADQNGTSRVSIAGGPVASNNYLIDGISITDTNNRPVVIPSIEAVQEVRVDTTSYDAQVGRTGGGVFNTLLKSGSNQLHGSLVGHTRQGDWLANDFFYNANGIPRPNIPYYNYAGSIGGPLVVPKLYDGRNKTFFWVSEEGYRQASPGSQSFAVPTQRERQGDFSYSFSSAGQLQTIYNPKTSVIDPATGAVTRSPYPGNIIPTQDLDPVGVKIASYFPNPQRASFTGQNNFVGTDNVKDRADEFLAKLDHQLLPWWAVNASYIHYGSLQPLGNFLDALPGSYSYIFNRHVDATQVNNVFTPSASTVVSVRWGFNRFPNNIQEVSYGFDPATLGLPGYLGKQDKFFPTIEMTNFATLGQNTASNDIWHSENLSANVARYIGKHSLRFGFDFRQLNLDFLDQSDDPGVFSFTGAFTRNSPTGSTATGSDLADLLIGLPSSGDTELSTKFYDSVRYYAGYLQDDWRLSPKLTLNLGLRYEYETGLQEKHNALAVGFATNQTRSLASQQASLEPKGGVLFAGQNGNPTSCCNLSSTKFAPRLGVAYAIDPRTTIRAGYGVLYAPLVYNPDASLAPGYTQYTPYIASNNGLATPVPGTSLSNPFPGGLQNPVGNSLGLLTGVGGPVSVLDQNLESPRVQQYSVVIDRELPAHIALETGYVGSHGSHLQPGPIQGGSANGAVNINQLDPKFFLLGNSLAAPVLNPFFGNGGTGVTGSATVAASQLLLPYPQFSTVNLQNTLSHSSYNSVIAKLQKRLSESLTFVASYTWSRSMDASWATLNSPSGAGNRGAQNAYNIAAEYSRSVSDTPSRFVTAFTYGLPFGKGKAFFNRSHWLDLAIGGWQLNGISTYQTGFPLEIHQNTNLNASVGAALQRPNATGANAGTSGSLESRLNNYLNVNAFSPAPAYSFGNLSRTTPVRGPGIANWDVSLFKEFTIHERLHLQFRAETFNTFNTPQFAAPNTAYGNPSFGAITSQANFPRYIQLGGRIYF